MSLSGDVCYTPANVVFWRDSMYKYYFKFVCFVSIHSISVAAVEIKCFQKNSVSASFKPKRLIDASAIGFA